MNDQNNLIDGLNTSQILVGLDLGTKTIGVAVSDRSKIIATPLSIIQRKGTNKDLIIMKDILKEYEIENKEWKFVDYKKLDIKCNRSNCVLSNEKGKKDFEFDFGEEEYFLRLNASLIQKELKWEKK